MVSVDPWHFALAVLPSLVLLHLFVSPYTKVEESFNIQAVHDLLKYGLPTNNVYLKLKAQFDHMQFPGAVPRTFIGAILLAGFSKPLIWLGKLKGQQQQFLVRAVLGTFNAAALLSYATGARRAYGKHAALWYITLQAGQYHVFYYASRTLPNMFAFCLSTIALSFLLPNPTSSLPEIKRVRLALYLLSLSAVIFRSELALLLGSQCLHLLIKSPTFATRLTLIRTVFLPSILSATVAGLLLTVSIDTYLWQSPKPIWPELVAFLSNVFPNKDSYGASAWGTSPWHWYFSSAMPRLILNPLLLLLIPYGLMTTVRGPVIDLLTPTLTYVSLYSILPHKETRFLFPIIPPLTLAVAISLTYLLHRRHALIKVLRPLALFSALLTALVSHAILLPLSAQTYPGAEALNILHQHLSTQGHPLSSPLISIHLTNLALQTGTTRFLQLSASPPSPHSYNNAKLTSTSQSPIILPGSSDGTYPALGGKRKPSQHAPQTLHYDKSDINNATALLDPLFWNRFDYVVVEDPGRAIGAWAIVGVAQTLDRRIRLLNGRSGMLVLPRIDTGGHLQQVQDNGRERDRLMHLFRVVYGESAATVYGIAHDVLREGYGVQWLLGKDWSWTRGWWVDCGLKDALFVLERTESGT